MQGIEKYCKIKTEKYFCFNFKHSPKRRLCHVEKIGIMNEAEYICISSDEYKV